MRFAGVSLCLLLLAILFWVRSETKQTIDGGPLVWREGVAIALGGGGGGGDGGGGG